MVLSDAVMHFACVVMAFRWWPYLSGRTHELEVVQVVFGAVRVAGDRLDVIVTYGGEIRSWTVPVP